MVETRRMFDRTAAHRSPVRWTVTEAAAAAGLYRRRWYEYGAVDADSAADGEEADERGADEIEDELRRRAFGYDEETWDG